MVVTCEINFKNNSLGTYYAGQVVSGNVILNVTEQKMVKGMCQINL